MKIENGHRRKNLSSVGDALELAVPVVLALDHASSVKLSALQLHRHYVPRRLVKQLHRNSQTTAHFLFPSSSSPTSLCVCLLLSLSLSAKPLETRKSNVALSLSCSSSRRTQIINDKQRRLLYAGVFSFERNNVSFCLK